MSYTGRFRRSVSQPTLKYIKGNIGANVGADNKDEVNIKGEDSSPIVTAGNSATHTLEIQIKDATTTQKGVLPLASQAEVNTGTVNDKAVVPSALKVKLGAQTAKGLPYGKGDTNPINWSRALTDGEVMVGSTSGDPAPAKITSSDGSLSVVSGSNSIDLKTGTKIPTSIVAEQGTAVPSSNSFNLFGDNLIDTVARGNTINVNTKKSVLSEVQAGGTSVAPKNHLLKFTDGQYAAATGDVGAGSVTIDVKNTVASFLRPDSGGNASANNRTFKIEGGTGCTTKRNSTGDGVVVDVTESGGGLKLNFTTSRLTNMQANKGYVSDYAFSSTPQFKLPTTAARGDMISLSAGRSQKVRITQNSGDIIRIGDKITTRGTSGYIEFLDYATSLVLYLHSTTSTTKSWRVYSGFFANIKVM